ncbi:8-oxoguanine DNA glycosylase OGG fold protein [Rhodococcoides trifolii]|nr:hypothetical protein [Rhodococcus trifolii]
MTAWVGEPALPEACIEWCRARSYEYDVLGDQSEVDLDWWNTRLRAASIPAELHAGSYAGFDTDTGIAYIRRGDLATQRLSPRMDLTTLYLCAAWLIGNRARTKAKRFADARDFSDEGKDAPFERIESALDQCRCPPALFDLGPQRQWSGWPKAPGFGPVTLSLFAWAAGSDAMIDRPQLVDEQALCELVHLGWVEKPAATGITVKRYLKYCEVLSGWSRQAGVRAELIEMWLVRSWRARQRSPSPFLTEFRDAL